MRPASPGKLLRPLLKIKVTKPITGMSCRTLALIDTGADKTVIAGQIAAQIGHVFTNSRGPEEVITASGVAHTYPHSFFIEVYSRAQDGSFNENDIAMTMPEQKLAVLPELRQTVLGVKDFLRDYVLTVDYPNDTFSIHRPTA